LQSATVDDNFILSAVNRARVLDLQGREESWLVLAAFAIVAQYVENDLQAPSTTTAPTTMRATRSLSRPLRSCAGGMPEARLDFASERGTRSRISPVRLRS